MPIKKENLSRYPKDWKQIRERILERAKNRCEECGVKNHSLGYRDSAGTFYEEDGERFIPDSVFDGNGKLIKIVLTISHLDHTPENCQPENLKALCQKCHLAYDSDYHAKNAAITRRQEKGNLELFPEVQV